MHTSSDKALLARVVYFLQMEDRTSMVQIKQLGVTVAPRELE